MSKIGKVLEVYLPKQYKDNKLLLDVMDREYLGFKIKTANGIENIILFQDENNGKIMKGDMVIIEQNDLLPLGD